RSRRRRCGAGAARLPTATSASSSATNRSSDSHSWASAFDSRSPHWATLNRPTWGGTMIDHVTAKVSDFDQGKNFYSQALAPLGYSVQMEFGDAAGFGSGEGIPDFWIGVNEERGATHVAFTAKDR